MPDAIWDKIAKGLFWDDLNLDILKSNGVAFQLFSWHWGSGNGWKNRVQSYLKSKGIDWDKTSSKTADVFNKLIDKQGEKQTIDDLQEQQIQFYKSLNQPTFINGWINRVKDTTNYAYNYVGKIYRDNENKINYTIIGIALIGITFLAYRYYKKNK